MRLIKGKHRDYFGNYANFYRCIEDDIVWAEIYPVLYGRNANSRCWFQSGEVYFKTTEDTKEPVHQRSARWVVKYVDDKNKEYAFKYFRYFKNAKLFAENIIREKLRED